MKRGTCWVIKEQVVRNMTGSSPMNYDTAVEYGDIEFVTTCDLSVYPGGTLQGFWSAAVDKWARAFNPETDYVITTGQPAAIFMAGLVLGRYNKVPRVLVWRREEGKYVPVNGRNLVKEAA